MDFFVFLFFLNEVKIQTCPYNKRRNEQRTQRPFSLSKQILLLFS
jgi:hypothetical protein